jgi:hypothetical protein
MNDTEALYTAWMEAKEAERVAIETRRQIEEKLSGFITLSKMEGITNYEDGEYQIRISSRIDRKVDPELVQEIAAEHGLTDHLSSLFRWKPEVNLTAWKAADDSITRPLSEAITAKPARLSFTITRKES